MEVVVGLDAVVAIRTGVTDPLILLVMLLPSICMVVVFSIIYRSHSK